MITMKNSLIKTSKKEEITSKHYLIEDSIKVINKHFNDLSISISGELTSSNAILVRRQFHKIEFDMF